MTETLGHATIYGRKNLELLIDMILRGENCRVVGPKYRKKTKLLLSLVDQLQLMGTHEVVYVNLAQDVSHFSEESFLADIFMPILKNSNYIDSGAVVEAPSNVMELQFELSRIVKFLPTNLLLIFDDIEVVPDNLLSNLLDVLRVVIQTSPDIQGPRLQVVICGAIAFSKLAHENIDRFEYISKLFVISDLDLNDCQSLLRKKADLEEKQVDRFADYIMDLTQGDTLLTNVLIEQIWDLMIEADTKRSDINEFLKQVVIEIDSEPEILETLSRIENDDDIFDAIINILENGYVHETNLLADFRDDPNDLDLTGVVKKEGSVYLIKCDAWKIILSRYFYPDRIGNIFSKFQRWDDALAYYSGLKSKVADFNESGFASTLLYSISMAETIDEVFARLKSSLAMVSDYSELEVYQRRGKALKKIEDYGQEEAGKLVLLNEVTSPQIKAYYGYEHTVLTENGIHRLYIPIRAEGHSSQGFGLISAVIDWESAYKANAKVLYLLNIVKQVGKVIQQKQDNFYNIEESDKLNQNIQLINGALTALLGNQTLSVIQLWKMVLEIITHGWGFAFNRSVLLLFDSKTDCFRATLAIGARARENAEKKWEENPFQDISFEDWKKNIFSGIFASEKEELEFFIKDLVIRPNDTDYRELFLNTSPQVYEKKVHAFSGSLRSLDNAISIANQFALIPFNGGILYVDNKFTGTEIFNSQIDLLRSFLNQVSLIIFNNEQLRILEDSSKRLSELSKAETQISSSVLQPLNKLIETISENSFTLFRPDEQLVVMIDAESYEFSIIDQKVKREEDITQEPSRSAKEELEIEIINAKHDIFSKNSENVLDSIISIIQNKLDYQSVGRFQIGTIGLQKFYIINFWKTIPRYPDTIDSLYKEFARFSVSALESSANYTSVLSSLSRYSRSLDDIGSLMQSSITSGDGNNDETQVMKQTLAALSSNLNPTCSSEILRIEPGNMIRSYLLNDFGQIIINEHNLFSDNCNEDIKDLSINEIFFFDWSNSEDDYRILPDELRKKYGVDVLFPIFVSGSLQGAILLKNSVSTGTCFKEIQVVQLFANALAVAFENIEVYKVLNKLLDVAVMITKPTSQTSQGDILKNLLLACRDALQSVKSIILYEYDTKTGRLILGHEVGVEDKSQVNVFPPNKTTVLDAIWELDGPIFEKKITKESVLYGPFVQREGNVSAAAMPLFALQENTKVGCMFFNYAIPQDFSPGIKSLLKLFSQFAAVAIQKSKLEDEIKSKEKRIAMERMGVLASNFIHDISKMFSNLTIWLDKLEKSASQNKDVSEPLNMIRDLIEQSSFITARLRNRELFESFEPEIQSLEPIVDSIILELAFALPDHIRVNKNIKIKIDEQLVWIDRYQIEIILNNLVYNSIDHIPPEKNGEIEISVTSDQANVFLSVEDNGLGIEPEIIGKIFDLGFSTRSNKTNEVHGFGLFLCQSIAKSYDGKIEVESVPGERTRFTLSLPRAYLRS